MSRQNKWDVIVIGGGIAGASAAYEMAETAKVVVLERESVPGYHATGRSAAYFIPWYGNHCIQALTSASRGFFIAPTDGFTPAALYSKRGLLVFGGPSQEEAVRAFYETSRSATNGLSLIDGHCFEALIPAAKPGAVSLAVQDTSALELDVHALHQGYLRGLHRRGGEVACGKAVRGLRYLAGQWRVHTDGAVYEAPTVVNAGGAWADEIAVGAGLDPLGLTPKRRTVCLVEPPPGLDLRTWPLAGDVEETFYFKPEGDGLLISPEDETPSPPCDAQPEELDVAVAVDRVLSILDFTVSRIQRKWAGLRTFARDDTPVVGFDPRAAGFFWLAGQGGYGIQTAPAMGRLSAALVGRNPAPADLLELGLDVVDLAPQRLLEDV